MGVTRVKAQDIHFTQFFASPLTLNPAHSGLFDGDWRVAGIYRNQWRSFRDPINSIAGSFDYKFQMQKHSAGAGLVVVSDNTNGLNVLKIYGSGAFHLKMGKSTLSFGLQLGYVRKTLGDDLTYPDQFNIDSGYFDGDLTTGDAGIKSSLGYFDLNAGFIWSGDFGKFKPEIGVSAFHLTFPKESFFGEDDRLEPRPVVHAKAVWDILPKFYLEPQVLFMSHSGATDFIAGLNLGFRLPENAIKLNSLYIGPYFREGFETAPNAAMVAAGMTINKNLQLGAAYDLNISELRKATNLRGAFEVYFIYIHRKNPLDIIQVPCERL